MSAAGITVYLQERLGNQLFMYAAALAQARRLGCPLYANLSSYARTYPERPHALRFELGGFDHGMTFDPDIRTHRRLRRFEPGEQRMARVREWLPIREKVFVERSSLFDAGITTVTAGTTLVGYFQSWRYFASVANELRRRLSALGRPSSWLATTADRIGESGSIVLNVRRGDYTKAVNQQNIGLASAAYYARALRLLRRLGVSGPVFVVSDELDLAMAELADIPDLQPIAPPAGTDLIEIVLAMSRAHAMVMANSTFSWWAAWLGDRPDRPVIAPRPWFNTLRLSERDLLLPHWVSLEARDVTGEPGATDLAVAAGESA